MLLNPYRFGGVPLVSLTGLVSYWRLDELSGDALDIHGTNHLTDFNTVSSAVGKVNSARNFVRANGEYFSRASGASLSMGDTDFTWSVWVKLNTTNCGIISKWIFSGPENEFYLNNDGANNFNFSVKGPSAETIRDSGGGTATLGVWHHLIIWHDAGLDQIGLVLNGGTARLSAHAGGVNSYPNAVFNVGDVPVLAFKMDGLIDELGFWRRVLTPAERTQLYNSGNGLTYPFDGSIPTLIPVAAFSGTPLTGTFPLAVTFTDLSVRSPTSWAWEKNNGSGWVPFSGTPSAQNPTETFTAGTWDVRLTATNAGGSDDEVKIGYVSNLSPLLTNLVSYWKLDEASGTAIDSHGINNLTDNNTVTSAAGKIGTARDFEKDNTEWLSCASNASLQTGDINFTFSLWIKSESFGTVQIILGKDNGGSSREYLLNYDTGSNRYALTLFPNGNATGAAAVFGNALGAPSVGVWYFIVVWHDSVANKIYMQINNGGIDEASISGTFVGTAQFILGALDNSGSRLPFDGLIDEVGFWKRILTPAERTALYNAGNGLAYPFT
jgi:PKD repeat protein